MNKKRKFLNNNDRMNIAKYMYRAMKGKEWFRYEVVEAVLSY